MKPTPPRSRPDSFSLHASARRQRARLMGVLLRRFGRRLSRALSTRPDTYPRAIARASR